MAKRAVMKESIELGPCLHFRGVVPYHLDRDHGRLQAGPGAGADNYTLIYKLRDRAWGWRRPQ